LTPFFQPQPVNDPFGDPVVYIDFLYERRALLFDLGEIGPLSPRKILRLTHVFVSHTHMDHFMGFDRILRTCLGRDQTLELFGPAGLVERVGHRLASFSWNLVGNFDSDFTVVAHEIDETGAGRLARFRCQAMFREEDESDFQARDGVLLDEDGFRVRGVTLDHRIPCLAFALEEKQHVNIWKNRLDEIGLATGPWLRELRAACRRGDPDDTPIPVQWETGTREPQGDDTLEIPAGDGGAGESQGRKAEDVGEAEGRRRVDACRPVSEPGPQKSQTLPLGFLKERVLRIVDGQKIGYVVDAVHHAENARRIVELVEEADVLFIEAAFLEADAERAARTYHLTAAQAGRLARRAGVKRMVPFHFSTRYSGRPEPLRREAARTFTG
jgi:ribonuclease Z